MSFRRGMRRIQCIHVPHDERDRREDSAKGQTEPGEQRVNEEYHEDMRERRERSIRRTGGEEVDGDRVGVGGDADGCASEVAERVCG
jgi:hypothetical protein